jgi:hypothetical protein
MKRAKKEKSPASFAERTGRVTNISVGRLFADFSIANNRNPRKVCYCEGFHAIS